MRNTDKILALIKLANNKIDGRTKFQKIVYLLKNHGVDFSEKFKYHYFGPYSSELQLEIEELVEQGIIKERSSNPYVYMIDDKFINEINDDILKEKKALIDLLVNEDYQDLELLATIHYLVNNNLKDENALKNKLKMLKPQLKNRIDYAFSLYKEELQTA